MSHSGCVRSRKSVSGGVRTNALKAAARCIYCGPSGIDPARITATVVCAVLGVAMLVSGRGGAHNTAADLGTDGQTVLRMPVTVAQGDSLWRIAQRYGNSDGYIQDSVDAIANANHLSANTTLQPGQRLIVPVTNPVEIARIQTRLASR